jgi:hypothetical protein
VPKRKDEAPDSMTVKVRLSLKLLKECKEAKAAGIHEDGAQSTFLGYLIKLGFAKYQRSILPAECDEIGGTASNEGTAQPVKTDKAQIVQHNSFSGETVFKRD